MKNRLISILLSIGLTAAMLIGCGQDAKKGLDNLNKENLKTSDASDNAKEVDSQENTSKGVMEADSIVYMIKSNAKTKEVWQDLAQIYTEKTGVSVKLVTSEDDDYKSALQDELSKDEAPTIFEISNVDEATTLNEYVYDLKNTSLYEHLTDKSLIIGDGEKIIAIANSYNCFGIIYNKKILNDYCSLDDTVIRTPEDIKSFDTLLAVATDINNRVDEINDEFGYDLTGAFTSSGLDNESSQRFTKQLASLPLYYEFIKKGCNPIVGTDTIDGIYLDQFKAVWDMYINTSGAYANSLSSGVLNSEIEMGTLEAVFYQNGDWELNKLTSVDKGYMVSEEDLEMIPIYFGVDDSKEGLCVGSESYWAINGKADKERIEKSLDFLNWVITSDEGRERLTKDMSISFPYDTFAGDYASKNRFVATSKKYVDEGKNSIAWSYMATPNATKWQDAVAKALVQYSNGSDDWTEVKKAFVDGWNNER